MEDIDFYIQQVAGMKNTSVGGSPSYLFGDVILVKYGPMPNKYGLSRNGAEQVAKQANELNANGNRTPKHLAIKRVQSVEKDKDEPYEANTCWVLQETAKGKPMTHYYSNKDLDVQLDMQSHLANAPDKHYEKYASDLQGLFNMGIELKPKNFFYDESIENGGFTVIDLLGNTRGEPPFNSSSTKDVLKLHGLMQSIPNSSGVGSYNDKASEQQKAMSQQYRFKIQQKIFSALENSIPDFDKHRRYVLRSIPQDVLEYFAQNGTVVGDLTLNPEEIAQFDKTADSIINASLEKVESGKKQYWEIETNEIRNDSIQEGMQDSWRYHPQNSIQRQDFESKYDFESANERALQDSLQERFETLLVEKSKGNTNPTMVEAMKALQAKQVEREQTAQHRTEMEAGGQDLW